MLRINPGIITLALALRLHRWPIIEEYNQLVKELKEGLAEVVDVFEIRITDDPLCLKSEISPDFTLLRILYSEEGRAPTSLIRALHTELFKRLLQYGSDLRAPIYFILKPGNMPLAENVKAPLTIKNTSIKMSDYGEKQGHEICAFCESENARFSFSISGIRNRVLFGCCSSCKSKFISFNGGI